MWATFFVGVKHYYRMKHLSICEILPPHLVLYVDVPVSEVKKRIEEVGEVRLHLCLCL